MLLMLSSLEHVNDPGRGARTSILTYKPYVISSIARKHRNDDGITFLALYYNCC